MSALGPDSRPTPPPSPRRSEHHSSDVPGSLHGSLRPGVQGSPEHELWGNDRSAEKTTENTDDTSRIHPSRQQSSSSGSSSRPSQPSSSESSYISDNEASSPDKKEDKESSRSGGQTDGDKDKVLKLSPTRLGELLADTPTPFALQMPEISEKPATGSPTRHRSSTTSSATAPVIARPPRGRMLSTPATMRRGKSSPRLEIITSPVRDPPRRKADGWGERSSHKSNTQTLSARRTSSEAAAYDTPPASQTPESSGPSSANLQLPPSTGHIKPPDSTGTSASFPPLPFQNYLTMALSSPTLQTTFSRSTPLKSDSTPHAYGPHAHHPDNSFAIAQERIMNFLLIPQKLEASLIFGVAACLDSWLYIFTILPLRFLKALGVLMDFWWQCIKGYVNYEGNKLKKQRRGSVPKVDGENSKVRYNSRRRREKKISGLLPCHKADLLRGIVVFVSCWVLMRFDASQIYHSIRGQSGIKLYVIYNMLEFGDRLLAAFGQDVFECLFAAEILERGPDGRSQILRPLGFLALALIYNILHSLLLFYQVVTLNVAVNSYSNALMTLLLSVQFVEIKATVFKKFEKENLFQLTQGDVVERFTLLLMLVVIASRNMVEMGVWSLAGVGNSSGGVLPKSFTFFPNWTGQVMGPFLMVMGSEMFVDWLKHAYITKFNNTRPAVYERFLDVMCRDYYSNAFSDQNLTKRLGLPVIPLACLFIRATIQTYHMFLATHVPLPPSVTTSITESSDPTSETHAALANFDSILRRALGGSSFGGNTDPTSSITDDIIAATTMVIFLLALFLIFLAVKLALGITLLRFARRRYKGIKERERMNIKTGARAVGGFGLVEVSEEQKNVIYEGDPEGMKAAVARERIGREKEMKTDMEFEHVTRYKMVAKRIW